MCLPAKHSSSLHDYFEGLPSVRQKAGTGGAVRPFCFSEGP